MADTVQAVPSELDISGDGTGGSFQKVYSQPNPANQTMRQGYTSYPLPKQLRDKIDPSQLIRILTISNSAAATTMIEAVNQRPLTFGSGSEWKTPPSPVSRLDLPDSVKAKIPFKVDWGNLADIATRDAFGTSTTSTLGTRRMWLGSQCMSVMVHLRFEAYNDANYEVYLPACKLLALPLPSRSKASAGGSDFFLIPPGPAAFPDNLIEKTWNAVTGNGSASALLEATGEQTTVRFGGIMTLKRVVVEDVQVTWDQRCDARGIPMAADLVIKFATQEILTKDAMYDAMLGVQT